MLSSLSTYQRRLPARLLSKPTTKTRPVPQPSTEEQLYSKEETSRTLRLEEMKKRSLLRRAKVKKDDVTHPKHEREVIDKRRSDLRVPARSAFCRDETRLSSSSNVSKPTETSQGPRRSESPILDQLSSQPRNVLIHIQYSQQDVGASLCK